MCIAGRWVRTDRWNCLEYIVVAMGRERAIIHNVPEKGKCVYRKRVAEEACSP